MKYRSDDVVTTRDGVEHRVIYEKGTQVFVRTIGTKSRKPHFIAATSIIEHKPKGK